MGSMSRVGSDLDNISESSSWRAISHKSFDFDSSVMNSPVYLRAVQQWTSSSLPLRPPNEPIQREPSINVSLSPRSDTDEGYGSHTSGSINQGPFGISQSQGDLLALPNSPSGPVHSRSVSHTQIHQRPPVTGVRRNLSESQVSSRIQQSNPTKSKFSSLVERINTGSRKSLRGSSKKSAGIAPSPTVRERGHRIRSNFHTSIDLSKDGVSVSPLIKAAQGGTRDEVERLLERGYNIEERHESSGRNALLVASHCGKEDIVDLLIQCGARLKVTDGSGDTALHLAASRGHWEVIELLVAEKSLIETPTLKGRTALRVAADQGQPEAVQILLEHYALVNARAENQMTALHAAAKRGDDEIVQMLISYRADIEAKDGNMMTALHYACEEGHMGVAKLLLDCRANIEAPGRDRKTPLICAAATGRAHIVEYLVKRKASVRSADDSQMTALHWAAYNGHEDTVRFLSERKGTLNDVNNMGRTALHLAVMQSQFAVVELLQRKGVSIETRCNTGLTALHYACMANSFEITQLLLLCGANIEASESEHEQTPLHIAAARPSMPLLDLLCDKGASLYARNGIGDRPVCVATRFGHVEAVQKLIDRGSPLSYKFDTAFREDSPLCLAAMSGHIEVVELLLERGASILKEDEAGWQPIRYAAYHGHSEVLRLLLSSGKIPNATMHEIRQMPETIGFAASVSDSTKQQVQALFSQAPSRPLSFGQASMKTQPPVWNMRSSPLEVQQPPPKANWPIYNFEDEDDMIPELPGSLEKEHPVEVESVDISRIATPESGPLLQQPQPIPIPAEKVAALLAETREVSPIRAQSRPQLTTRGRSPSRSKDLALVSATYTPIAIPYHTRAPIQDKPNPFPKQTPTPANPTEAEQTPRTLPFHEHTETRVAPQLTDKQEHANDSDSDSISSVYTAPDGDIVDVAKVNSQSMI